MTVQEKINQKIDYYEHVVKTLYFGKGKIELRQSEKPRNLDFILSVEGQSHIYTACMIPKSNLEENPDYLDRLFTEMEKAIAKKVIEYFCQ